MRRLLTLVFLLTLLGTSLWMLWEKSPCIRPIEYSIGTFDERFGIDQETFQDAIKDASKPWEKETGRELFRFVPDAEFRINLVYDERQEQTDASKRLEAELDQTKAVQQKIGQDYASIETEYKKKKNGYELLLATFTKRLDRYNTDVEKWNEKGGAPKDEYERLQKESKALDSLGKEVESARQAVNVLVEKMNTFSGKETAVIEKYNTHLNNYVSRYGESREFDQGVYTGAEINVYQFRDLSELRLVLAHELGHSLGLNHIENTASIMYYLMGGQDIDTITLSSEDKQQLQQVCGSGEFSSFQVLVTTFLAPWKSFFSSL
ncbi:MAG: matrixin family metalloprotease [Patescibacteria group bacterium]